MKRIMFSHTLFLTLLIYPLHIISGQNDSSKTPLQPSFSRNQPGSSNTVNFNCELSAHDDTQEIEELTKVIEGSPESFTDIDLTDQPTCLNIKGFCAKCIIL